MENETVDVFVFSSQTITNIWAGYGAETWAVTPGESKAKKSERLAIGSLGILYCVPWKAFTVPFVTTTLPDKEHIEKDIWQNEWVLPFKFKALSSPRHKIFGRDLYAILGGMKDRNISNYSNYLNVQSNFDFQPSKISRDDWSKLVEQLVTHA